jgi:hypothetical protein
MSLDVRELLARAAAAASALDVGALARRRGGVEGFVSRAPLAAVIVAGSRWPRFPGSTIDTSKLGKAGTDHGPDV